jgi:uncharacterized membrane protein
MDKKTIYQGKTIAVIGYILIIGFPIAFSMNSENKNPYASFHIRQGLGLSLTFVTLGLTISHFESIMIAAPMWISATVLMFYGIFSAISGSTKPIPLVGKFYQSFLKNIS